MKKQIKPLEACRLDLFTSEDELREKYSEPIALRVLRIREEYNWFLSNPDAKDRQFVENVTSRFGLNKTQAYSDLALGAHIIILLFSRSDRHDCCSGRFGCDHTVIIYFYDSSVLRLPGQTDDILQI